MYRQQVLQLFRFARSIEQSFRGTGLVIEYQYFAISITINAINAQTKLDTADARIDFLFHALYLELFALSVKHDNALQQVLYSLHFETQQNLQDGIGMSFLRPECRVHGIQCTFANLIRTPALNVVAGRAVRVQMVQSAVDQAAA
jgi:hypothetical protein